MINIAQPIIESEEIDAVNEVLRSGNIAQGPRVAQLEEDFARFCGTKYALAVNSGTAALHAALYATGMGVGDEVITVPFSFIATINPILMQGSKPVLVDIDYDTFNLDVTRLESVITNKTKAIIPVHLYGQPANMNEINTVAKKHGIKVIEDACQAVDADYGDKKTGNLGDLGCFSLYATKNIMCGEGGMVTTNSEDYANLIRKFRQHGMVGPYMYDDLGYNYRMTDLQASIAIEQLKKATRFTSSRQKNAEQFNNAFAKITGLVLPKVDDGRNHVYHQYTLRVTDDFHMTRDEFVQALRDKGVGAGVYYPKALHTYPHIARLEYKENDFPQSVKAANECVSLPVHPGLTDEDIATVISAVKSLSR